MAIASMNLECQRAFSEWRIHSMLENWSVVALPEGRSPSNGVN